MKHGTGTFRYPDGAIYEGEWHQNLREGYGTYTYPNGDSYKGSWHKGRKHGLGDYIHQQDGLTLHATWERGEMKGPVEIISANGSRFHGYYQDGRLLGPAVFSFNCKYMAVGYMEEEKKKPISVTGLDVETEKESVPNTEWTMLENRVYKFSELPQGPYPLPVTLSTESLCESVSTIGEEDGVEGEVEAEEEVEQVEKGEEIQEVEVKNIKVEGEKIPKSL